MRLAERLARLVKADAHGLLDQVEERGLLARQHLREAELELDRKRARLEALQEEAGGVREEVERLQRDAAGLDADVERALGSGEQELARFAARRWLARRRALEALATRREHLAQAEARLAALLGAQEQALDALRRRVRARCDEPVEAEPGIADEEVELELLRRREGR